MLVPHRRIVRTVSYSAGAGFWIYLVHHPLVALIHLDLKLVFPELAPFVKSLISATVAVGVSLATYECVRMLRRLSRGVEQEMPKAESAEQASQAESIKLAAREEHRRAA
jgi:glucans biosynthesis protein C